MSLPMRTPKHIFCCLLLFVPAVAAFCQQELSYTQFMLNKLYYNPAYAGSFESPTLSASHRSQWMGKIEGAPNTQTIAYDQPAFSGRVGVGVNLTRQSIAINRLITLEGAYAYRIAFRRGFLSIGLKPSIRYFAQDWTDDRLITSQPISSDGAIPTGLQSKVIANVGFGVYYKGAKDVWYAGVAAPRLVNNNIDFAEVGGIFSREVQHWNAMGGMTFALSDDTKVTAQALLKYAQFAPLDAELNVSIMLHEKFFTGVTYRVGGDTKGIGESVDVLAGIQATKKLFVCVSYDIGLTRLRKFHNGTLELNARWWFNPPEGNETVNPNRL